jgi:transcriptional regulator with XRE-family HTH domain
MKTLGETIKDIRKQRGMSQRELATLAKMNKVYIYRIEKGEVSPTIKTLQKIADAFGGELKITIGETLITKKPAIEEVIVDDTTRFNLILLHAYSLKNSTRLKNDDKQIIEQILDMAENEHSEKIVTFALDATTTRGLEYRLPIHSLIYDVDINSYKLVKTEDYAPFENRPGYLAVKKGDIVIFKKESKEITDTNKTVLIKFTSEVKRSKRKKIFMGTYGDFLILKNIKTTVIEKYTVAYIIPS